MRGFRLIVKDRGWRQIKRNVKRATAYVKVGFMGDSGAYKRKSGNEEAKPATLVQVASFNEFGTVSAPGRPFMRTNFDRNQTKYIRVLERLGSQIVTGSLDYHTALNVAGLTLTADIKRTIVKAKGWAAPNTASTIRSKGSTSPLIDSGRMRQSVRHVVVLGNAPPEGSR